MTSSTQRSPIFRSGYAPTAFDELPSANRAQLFVVSRGGTEAAMFATAKLNALRSYERLRHAMKQLESLTEEVVASARSSVAITGHVLVDNDWCVASAVAISARLAAHLNVTKMLPSFHTIKTKHDRAVFVDGAYDVVLMVKANRTDLCYKVVREFIKLCDDDCVEWNRTVCFKFDGGRDLSGFMDGTRNFDMMLSGVMMVSVVQEKNLNRNFTNVVPAPLHVKELLASLYSQDDEGASFVFVGKFRHDLASFSKLSDAAKSEVVGRDITKVAVCELLYAQGRLENPLLDSEPDDSHIQRSAGAMTRQAWPYVEGSDEGLFFSAFSRDPNILLSSLCSMAGLTGGGVDRLLQFTTGVQCGIYFVPSKTQLAKLF